MNQGDIKFEEELFGKLYAKYKKNPKRAENYCNDIFALYNWLKGRHSTLQEIMEGMGWSLNKAKAVIKIARDCKVIKPNPKNSEEYQITKRRDLTPNFRAYRYLLFITPNPDFGVQTQDIIDWLEGDYSLANQERVVNEAWQKLGIPAMKVDWWRERYDKYWGIERDINGNIATPETDKKLLKRGSRFL